MIIQRLYQRLQGLGRIVCRPRNGTGSTRFVRCISKRLGLDEQQQEKLIALQEHFRTGREGLRKTWSETHQGVTELLATETSNSGRLRAFLRDELSNKLYLANAHGNAFITAFAELYETLDTEQRRLLHHHWQRTSRPFTTCHQPH